MNINIEQKENYVIVALAIEKLGGVLSPELKSQFVNLNSQGNKNIILDLSATRYCDSSGLSAILVGNRLCKNSNGTFVIAGAQEMVMKLIVISQLNSILNLVPTVSEAIDFLNMEEVEREIGSED